MTRLTLLARLLALLLAGCGPDEPTTEPLQATPPYPSQAAHNVDPFIGTAGEGNTFPGAVAPWGMVSVSPHNHYSTPVAYVTGEPVAPAGYIAGKPHIYGFGHTHLSGVGCPDLGAPLLALSRGALTVVPDKFKSRYAGEVAWPGYYGVKLTDHGARVQTTAAFWAGVTKVTFSGDGGRGHLLLDAGKNLSWAGGQGEVRLVSDTEVEGWAATGFFCGGGNSQRVYFAARLSRAPLAAGTWKERKPSTARAAKGSDVGAYFTYPAGATVEVLVALSLVSVVGARVHLKLYTMSKPGFEDTRRGTFNMWDSYLGRVRVTGGTAEQRVIFYTALYHALIHPSLASDRLGAYLPFGGGKAASSARLRYTVFSLWDTYRTVHPLLTLLYPEIQEQMLSALTAMTVEAGVPPKWELGGAEVNMMVGDPLLPVLADSAAKGLTGGNDKAAYAKLLAAAEDTSAGAHRPGNASYRKLGYVPMEEAKTVWGPVSTTLEYAYADWALAQLAAALGNTADAAALRARAGSYKRLFHKATGLLRPRNRDGSWYTPFNPAAMEGSRPQKKAGGPGYVEGNAYQYSFFVPHDQAGLAALHGGAEPYVKALQRVFDEGHFTLWNEPDLAYPYLFTRFPGHAWRTQKEVRKAMASGFSRAPGGLAGNDDTGTLSAWYVFSAMGFYPDLPGSTRYSLGSPLFDRIELRLHRGTWAGTGKFVIEAAGAGARPYVKGGSLDGLALTAPALEHKQIVKGGTLRLDMSAAPGSW